MDILRINIVRMNKIFFRIIDSDNYHVIQLTFNICLMGALCPLITETRSSLRGRGLTRVDVCVQRACRYDDEPANTGDQLTSNYD